MPRVARAFLLFVLFFSVGVSAFGQLTANLPQIAIGGGYTTFITVKETSTLTQSITISLYNDQGNVFPASFDGAAPVSTFTFELPHDTVRVLTLTSPTGAARAGWASVRTSSGRINVSASYAVAGPGGTVADTVAVLPPQNDTEWTVYFKRDNPSQNVGVALDNPNAAPMLVQFDLFGSDTSQGRQQRFEFIVPPLGHFAGFITDIFRRDIRGVGVVRVRTISDTPPSFPVMALLLEQGQLSSLQANHSSAYATFVTPANATDRLQNALFLQNLDANSFSGTEVQGGTVVGSVLGFFDPTNSSVGMQRQATPGDGVTGGGVVIYQGTINFDTFVITGTRTVLKADGTIASATTFTATLRGGGL